jgi:hypothetical protein
MVPLTLIVVGFLVATAVVMALARGSTARWEQDRRAAVAARADESARRTSSAGSTRRTQGAVRRGVAALRGRVSRLAPVRAVVRLVPTDVRDRTSRMPLRRVVGGLTSSLSGAGAKLRAGRWKKSRPVPRALAFLHRHEQSSGAPSAREDSDQSPIAR